MNQAELPAATYFARVLLCPSCRSRDTVILAAPRAVLYCECRGCGAKFKAARGER
jgi:Zn ribbon nucleic-acid-binding protein